MYHQAPVKPKPNQPMKRTSRHNNVPPKNPNKRPTTINMERSIGRMKSQDMDIIRQAQ